MSSNVLGLIFSDIHAWGVSELIANRTVASIPFLGRYRLIDFTLSNMVNSDIYNIGVLTKSNYQSLIAHIGSGKEWDLSRKNGGLTILPPYVTGSDAGPYVGRLDALRRAKYFIESANCEYIILADCDIVYNIDYSDVIEYHKKSGADITCVYTETERKRENPSQIIVYDKIDENGRIHDIMLDPEVDGKYCAGLSTWVFNRDVLLHVMADANSHGMTSFFTDVLLGHINSLKLMGYKHEGYSARIDSLANNVKSSMMLLDKGNRNELFNISGRNIHTRVRDSSPTKYGSDAVVKNSLIADGCLIEGVVENSILFRGVKVNKGSVVKNCILMHDALIENNASLSWIITDKHVTVRDNRTLSADENYPFYIAKGKMV